MKTGDYIVPILLILAGLACVGIGVNQLKKKSTVKEPEKKADPVIVDPIAPITAAPEAGK